LSFKLKAQTDIIHTIKKEGKGHRNQGTNRPKTHNKSMGKNANSGNNSNQPQCKEE
jgi:hypothetical protein